MNAANALLIELKNGPDEVTMLVLACYKNLSETHKNLIVALDRLECTSKHAVPVRSTEVPILVKVKQLLFGVQSAARLRD